MTTPVDSSTSMVARTKPLSQIERLPPEVIGNILNWMNWMPDVGNNEAGCLDIERNAMRLASTSKTMHASVYGIAARRMLLDSMSEKYNQSPKDCIAMLSRSWLWDRIQSNGDKKTYERIQEIYKLASGMSEKAANAGLVFDKDLGQRGWPFPNTCYCQTKEGFELYIGSSPDSIATPFGEIKLFGGGTVREHSDLSVAEYFISELDAAFICIDSDSESPRQTRKLYEISRPLDGTNDIRKIPRSEWRELSEADAQNRQGSQNLIFSNRCGETSAYSIGKINGEPAPTLVWPPNKESRRSRESIRKIWEMLERNRLGQNPIHNSPGS